ncbi:MAG: hypothetical protein GWP08_07085 [Nitrospiraceae bacterium]|nr:hypothetical protein [Nitrospiraceae bacterium]
MLLQACLIAAACLCGAVPTGQIAFVAGTEQEDQRVHLLDLATGETTPIGPGNRDGAPVWSLDGQWLAFETKTEDGMGIYIVRADGSEGRILPHAFGWNQYPRWSPDARRLAYAANDWEEGASRIMVYDCDTQTESRWGGEEATGLTRPVWMPSMKLLDALHPDQVMQWGDASMTGLDWLKEGSTLVAICVVKDSAGATTDLYVATKENAAALPAWILPSQGRYAEWAAEPRPDGGRVAFESNDGGDREIFVLTNKGAFDVTNHKAADWNPVWAPDGEWLAFESFRGGTRGLYRVFPDTARVSPLAVTPGADNWWPTWAPDAKHVAFVSDRTGDPEIFVTDTSGQDVVQLTDRPGPDLAPAWRPETEE